jgi:hypothetical protein
MGGEGILSGRGMSMTENNMEKTYEAGAVIVKTLNELEEKKRRKLLKAHVGAILLRTKLPKNEKVKIIEELSQEVFKSKKKEQHHYIG